jgi:hypothetical protein
VPASTITDANGSYLFQNIPMGIYAMTVQNPGATFTPSSAGNVGVGAGALGPFVMFTCPYVQHGQPVGRPGSGAPHLGSHGPRRRARATIWMGRGASASCSSR